MAVAPRLVTVAMSACLPFSVETLNARTAQNSREKFKINIENTLKLLMMKETIAASTVSNNNNSKTLRKLVLPFWRALVAFIQQ